MADLWRVAFSFVFVLTAVLHKTLCVRHETFWGEKGKNYFSRFFVFSLFNSNCRRDIEIKRVRVFAMQTYITAVGPRCVFLTARLVSRWEICQYGRGIDL